MHMPEQAPAWVLAVIAAVAGLAVGPCLTVLANRLSAGHVRPGHVQPGHVLPGHVRPGHVLPGHVRPGRVLPGRVLPGRVRPGRAPGGWSLVVELGTGACFAVMALRFGPSPVLPAFLLLAALAPVLTLTDLRWRRLPDPLTLPAYPAAAALLAAGALAIPGGTRHFLSALAGLVVAWLFFALLAGIHPAGIGGGDVKLSGVLGLYLGWLGASAVAAGLLGAFVLAALAGLGLIAARRATRKTQIPFGPFMLASAIAVIAASGLVPALAR